MDRSGPMSRARNNETRRGTRVYPPLPIPSPRIHTAAPSNIVLPQTLPLRSTKPHCSRASMASSASSNTSAASGYGAPRGNGPPGGNGGPNANAPMPLIPCPFCGSQISTAVSRKGTRPGTRYYKCRFFSVSLRSRYI
jgi:hypothetical protein